VVLDLRRNGGGSLEEAIDLTGLFIDRGPVVQVRDSDQHVIRHNDDDPGMAWDGPLVVVTSKLSASASEILAGAIQDYHRGLVIGDEATHGKGTVQTPTSLSEYYQVPFPPNLGVLKITIQQFFRPNGASTQLRGVLSDIVLPSVTNYMDIGESDLDYPIEFKRIQPSSYNPLGLVNEQILTKLRAASEARIGQSDEFSKLLKRIEIYRARKERKSVTLNEKKFMAEIEDVTADRDEEERLADELNGDQKIKRDFYLNEVLAIASDYVQEVDRSRLAGVN
jgi:carboxyl-terminal processing protease